MFKNRLSCGIMLVISTGISAGSFQPTVFNEPNIFIKMPYIRTGGKRPVKKRNPNARGR